MAALVGLAGCDTSQYAFRIDESISFETPKARSGVDLPVVVRWQDHEPRGAARVDLTDPEASYYAVFVDRSPIGPGSSLASLADDPEACELDAACPDEVFLSDRGVFLTADLEVELEFLSDRRPAGRGKDQHDVTIVRMRGRERTGEAAWDQTFFVNR